eukprot:SAG31_NODE_418_length_15893_cov_5.433899_6_plen_200_part_00
MARCDLRAHFLHCKCSTIDPNGAFELCPGRAQMLAQAGEKLKLQGGRRFLGSVPSYFSRSVSPMKTRKVAQERESNTPHRCCTSRPAAILCPFCVGLFGAAPPTILHVIEELLLLRRHLPLYEQELPQVACRHILRPDLRFEALAIEHIDGPAAAWLHLDLVRLIPVRIRMDRLILRWASAGLIFSVVQRWTTEKIKHT